MVVYLVQHGAAVDEAVDPTRPLSPGGRADVQGLARGCAGRISAGEILHSGKLRAAQTAEILASALGAPVRAVKGLNPMDSPAPFAETLRERNDDTIVVGHLPFMERLAALLVTGREDPPVVAFQRGGMVCLGEGVGFWRILWTLFPDQPGIGQAGEEPRLQGDPGRRKES
jgi:phosphohistidine phosphatase